MCHLRLAQPPTQHPEMAATRHNPHGQHLDGLILLRKTEEYLRTPILGILPLHCTDSAYCFQNLAVLRYIYCPGFYPYCIFVT